LYFVLEDYFHRQIDGDSSAAIRYDKCPPNSGPHCSLSSAGQTELDYSIGVEGTASFANGTGQIQRRGRWRQSRSDGERISGGRGWFAGKHQSLARPGGFERDRRERF